MSNHWAAVVCSTGIVIAGLAAAVYGGPRRPAGEAWVVTASDKMASRPMLMRAHVPVQTAAVGSPAAP
jgi:hypothetical protein